MPSLGWYLIWDKGNTVFEPGKEGSHYKGSGSGSGDKEEEKGSEDKEKSTEAEKGAS